MNNGNVGQTNLGGATNGAGNGLGNNQLSQAFDYAINEASQTLTITTKKGADLYALKQQVR